MSGRGVLGPFIEEKPSQGAQIVEQAAARLQVLLQFIQLELNDAERFHAAIRLGRVEVGGNFSLGLSDGLDQEMDVFVGVLDTVKRRLRGSGQGLLKNTKVWRRGWDLNPRYPLRYVRFRGGP